MNYSMSKASSICFYNNNPGGILMLGIDITLCDLALTLKPHMRKGSDWVTFLISQYESLPTPGIVIVKSDCDRLIHY